MIPRETNTSLAAPVVGELPVSVTCKVLSVKSSMVKLEVFFTILVFVERKTLLVYI